MFAVLKTIENNIPKIFRCPNNWIKNDMLLWPNLKDQSLCKAIDCRVEPLENWNQINNFTILENNLGEC